MVRYGRPQEVVEPNIINHFQFILDASGSMSDHQARLIEVVDEQIAHLAEKSKSDDMDQETRVSIWSFSDANDIKCLVWDKDVLRLPSIAKYYQIRGMTAFVDAALKSFADVKTTSQVHGDHSFVFYFVTDGLENASYNPRSALEVAIKNRPENWTLAALVPDKRGVEQAKNLGFPMGNIKIWDATTAEGLEEAAREIKQSSTSFMKFRATGMKSTNTLFDMSAAAVNKQTIQAAGLTPLDPNEYILMTVVFKDPFENGDDWISNYTVDVLGHQYVAGRGYYQLTLAPVKVQIQKDIAIVEKKSGLVYTGKNARALLGMPGNLEVTLRASQNPDYDIFIQSTSSNRKLLHGQKYLYLTPQVTYTKGQPVAPVVTKAAPKVAKMPLSPKTVAKRAAVAVATSKKAALDLNAPVYPKAGKALWAGIKCPVCPSKANKRCQKPDGSPMEKPHAERKV